MQRRHLFVLAFLASLLLHAAVMVPLWNADLIGAPDGDVVRRTQEPDDQVEIVFEDADEPWLEPDRPTEYTSVPDRHAAEAPPENPDFLALNDSRAADLLEGGDDGRPGTERASEVDQVAISAHRGGAPEGGLAMLETPESRDGEGEDLDAGRGSDAVDERGSEAPPEDEGDTAPGAEDGEADTDGEAEEPAEEAATAPELVDLRPDAPPSILDDSGGVSGDPTFDYDQTAASSGGNMIQFGEFRLNTLSWDFAPWLENFKQDFLPHWIPPYAYRLGVIDGKTILRLVVEPDGTIGGLEVIERVGHESLHQASTAALRATAPFAPLPPDFPEDRLVLELGLLYTPLEEMTAPARSPQERPDRRRRPR